MGSPVERRKHKRIAVKIPAGIYFKNRPTECLDAEILDLSLGGAFVHCTAPIRIGDEILVEIRFAETQLIEAKVVIANDQAADKIKSNISERVVVKWARGSSHSGFGVEFVDLEPDKREYLAKLLQYFENLKKNGVHLPNR